MEEVVVIDAVRTPIGSFGGELKTVPAPDLGSVVIGALFKNSGLNPDLIEEVVMGIALPAGLGQAPARQAAMRAGLPNTTPACSVNMAGASGLKAVMFAAQQIQTGDAGIVVAGGMESMSNVPHYVKDARFGINLGSSTMHDGIIRDALTDIFRNSFLGNAAEVCAARHELTRELQDEFAAESHRRATTAQEQGAFHAETATVKVRNRSGEASVIERNEELHRFDPGNMRKLSPTFEKNGTITSANASAPSDGAAALLLMSARKADELDLTPVARIVSQASAAQDPQWFATAPAKAMERALHKAGKRPTDMDLIEISEDFAIVPIINTKLLGVDPSRVNVHGGAIAIGNPLGCSGARMLVTLIHALRQRHGTWGCAGICNGGGSASALVVERL